MEVSEWLSPLKEKHTRHVGRNQQHNQNQLIGIQRIQSIPQLSINRSANCNVRNQATNGYSHATVHEDGAGKTRPILARPHWLDMGEHEPHGHDTRSEEDGQQRQGHEAEEGGGG